MGRLLAARFLGRAANIRELSGPALRRMRRWRSWTAFSGEDKSKKSAEFTPATPRRTIGRLRAPPAEILVPHSRYNALDRDDLITEWLQHFLMVARHRRRQFLAARAEPVSVHPGASGIFGKHLGERIQARLVAFYQGHKRHVSANARELFLRFRPGRDRGVEAQPRRAGSLLFCREIGYDHQTEPARRPTGSTTQSACITTG